MDWVLLSQTNQLKDEMLHSRLKCRRGVSGERRDYRIGAGTP